ncbi:MAG TPA: hypothetical protein VF432_23200 [Thermoanaerobaculia bacterium]
MRKPLAVLLLLLAMGASVFAQTAVTPESRLALGITAYKSGDFASAVVDLQAAAQGFLSPEQMQAYVNTGRFERLQSFETALVYLALAQMRLNREDDARETLMRLHSAERIAPTYATLSLGPEASEIESLAAALTPGSLLPRNVQVAGNDDPTAALPAIVPKSGDRMAVKKTIAEEKAERQAIIDEIVARERERIQREADARIAAERETIEKQAAERIAASQRQADQRISAATSDAQQQIQRLRTDAEQRVAAAEAESQKRVAAAEAQLKQQIAAAEAEAKKNADARIAEIQRLTEERVLAERAAAERSATVRVSEMEAAARREYLLALRTAETAAGNGRIDEAVRIYSGLAGSTAVPREVLAEAAVGLYRTGSFREAAQAFNKFGTFAKGEEDLRYYYAVALYETGSYAEAQKELSCALPFIQVTDDVARYRVKIENTVAQTARK